MSYLGGEMSERPSQEAAGEAESSLQLQLQRLSQGSGVYQAGLLSLLRSELRDLYEYWELAQLGDALAPQTLGQRLEEILKGHLDNIPTYPRKPTKSPSRRKAFERAFRLGFNVGIPDSRVRALGKGDRQRLIALPAKGEDSITVITAQRDLKFAYAEIEKQILATGYEPRVPVSELKKSSGLRDSSTPSQPSVNTPDATVHQSTLPVLEPRAKKRRRWLAVVATVVVIAALGTVGYVVMSPGDDAPETPEAYISVQNSPIDYKLGQTTSPDLVIPHPLSEIDRPPPYDGVNLTEFNAWKEKHGAVHANTMHVTFVARGNVSEPTAILDAKVDVVRREAPLAGTWIKPDGGDQGPVRQLYADLDEKRPQTSTDGTWQYPLRVFNTDPEIFTVTVRTSNCHCYWRVVLKVNLPNNKSAEIVVDDGGKPFEITSSTAAIDKTYLAYGPDDGWPQPVLGG